MKKIKKVWKMEKIRKKWNRVIYLEKENIDSISWSAETGSNWKKNKTTLNLKKDKTGVNWR